MAEISYPALYELNNIFIELCEVVVEGKFIILKYKMVLLTFQDTSIQLSY